VSLLSISSDASESMMSSITQFRKACGVSRHAYNWANATINEVLKQGETDKSVKVPSAIDLHKKLVAEVKSANTWYYEINKNVSQQALKELRTVWDRCFKKVAGTA
jgi:putative transposase